MIIGIDASRAFLRNRTGIEEYAYRVIEHLRGPLRDEEVVLYVRPGQGPDFGLPAAWRVKTLRSPRFWTHGRLSIEMLLHRPDVLFIPAHTVPIIHPRRSVVTVHGLEYEFSPESYSWWERCYMRTVIRFSCRAAETIIAVSEHTKGDLVRLYGVPEHRIVVVYEGKPELRPSTHEEVSNLEFRIPKGRIQQPYLLSIGRIEERKNVRRIVEAFDILKSERGIPHRLVLVGKPGYGYVDVRKAIEMSPFRGEIVETGYRSEVEKTELLRDADVFVFPSLYEGFGLPLLEAQQAGVPVVASDVSSLPEVGGEGMVRVDPRSSRAVADGIWRILSDSGFRDAIIRKGRENAARFDWEKCSAEIARLLRGA